jgi:hypothetical protein
VGESEDSLPPVERLLRCESEAAHAAIAELLWESQSDSEAMAQLAHAADTELPRWEQQLRERPDDGGDATAQG